MGEQTAYTLCILGPDNLPAGTGVLVGGGSHIISCAHVVALAQGLNPREAPKKGVEVRCEPMLGGGPLTARTLCVWPWVRNRMAGRLTDIAVLEIVKPDDLPAGAGPARFENPDNRPSALACGYPWPATPGQHVESRCCWVDILAPNSGGRWQLHQRGGERKIEPGYSGGPVVYKDGEHWPVIGMADSMLPSAAQPQTGSGLVRTISRIWRNTSPETAFMIPASDLREALKQAGVPEPPSRRAQASFLADDQVWELLAALAKLLRQPLAEGNWSDRLRQALLPELDYRVTVPATDDPDALAEWLLRDLPGGEKLLVRVFSRVADAADIREAAAPVQAMLSRHQGFDEHTGNADSTAERIATALVLELTPRDNAPPVLTPWLFSRSSVAGEDGQERARQLDRLVADDKPSSRGVGDQALTESCVDKPRLDRLARSVDSLLNQLPRGASRVRLEIVAPPDEMVRWEDSLEILGHRRASTLGCEYPILFRSAAGFTGRCRAKADWHWNQVCGREAIVANGGRSSLSAALARGSTSWTRATLICPMTCCTSSRKANSPFPSWNG